MSNPCESLTANREILKVVRASLIRVGQAEMAQEMSAAIISDENKNNTVADLKSLVKNEMGEERKNIASSETVQNMLDVTLALFQNEDKVSDGVRTDSDDDDDDSGADNLNVHRAGTQLKRSEHSGGINSSLPDTFHTGQLLFYERFKAYQDYILGDCKPSEVKSFTADYLKNLVQSFGWQALWSAELFDVLVEVCDVDFSDLKARVKLVFPLQCEVRGFEINKEAIVEVLEATQHKVPLVELQVVYEESGDYDQIALAIEHLRFFYKHVWRLWDEEDEDDDFDYFVRCVEPRLRLYYDILEERVPAGLVSEYKIVLEKCTQCFQQFSLLRSSISSDSDSELDNISMVEGLKLYEQLEVFKRKLYFIENPLLRYVLGYKSNARHQFMQSRGLRESGIKVAHVVLSSCTANQLQSLLNERLLQQFSSEDTEVQFHRDPVSAVDSCHQGDMVFVLPGVYNVTSSILLPDSITVEGFGLPDDVVIEKKNKGDSLIESTGADVKMSNIKFIQHEDIEGILCVREGNLAVENCVLQCETTGVIVQASAHLTMNMCDLYGSKGAGIEIYPGSACTLVGNGIHHCKDGILIKMNQPMDLAGEVEAIPSITMDANVIHNNEGYGVVLVKPSHSNDRNIYDKCAEKDERVDVEQMFEDGLRKNVTGRPMASPSQITCKPEDAPPNLTENTHQDSNVNSARNWQFYCQLSINRQTSCTLAMQDVIAHKIFRSIKGNQFRRNGMGDFGTFLY
ncbi:SHC SH2 domain-binding protein 1 [Syngnathoides biaculeatus]|uniref:SHC SH2 domain-binding protein 1 n=1 Tax=Syngnathoides biaculeatus TaxID=300417 RepID=UPI002ADD4332|nr:SHC SH2 domain-binding protein 1 [Syngnathoides biaculeatus]